MEKEIYIDGEINIGLFKKVKNDIGNISQLKKLVVNINSNGGYVTEGMDIYHYLNDLKNKGVEVCCVAWGMCASIAVAIFLAGKERVIHEHTKFLIHLPTAYCEGNSEDMTRQAQRLIAIENNILDLYIKVTNVNKQILYNEMKKNTFMQTQKVLEYKFATNVKKINNARNQIFTTPTLKLEMEKNYKTLCELTQNDKLLLGVGVTQKGKLLAKNAKAKLSEYELNMTFATDSGQSVYVYTENEVLEGKLIVLANPDGSPTATPAPDGKHILNVSDSKIEIEVLDGVVTKVTPLETEKAPEPPAEEAKKDDETMQELNKIMSELEVSRKEQNELKIRLQNFENSQNALTESIKSIESILKTTGSEKNATPKNKSTQTPNPNRFYE